MPVGGIMPGAKLPDDLFADIRMIPERREIHLIEQQVRGLQPLVVAGDAVLVDGGALCRGVGRSRLLSGHERRRQQGRPASEQQICSHEAIL